MSDSERETLHKRNLTTSEAILALGTIVARQLIEYGESSVYISQDESVCIASPGEFSMDALPEEMAIHTLLDQDWTEEEVAQYLEGRDARLKRRG